MRLYMFQVSIRITSTRSDRRGVKKLILSLQHCTGEHSVSGRRLRHLVNAFSVVAVVLIVFAVLCCGVFIVIDHMTLTIFSNNFVIILATVLSNLILLRIQKIKSKIQADQHKVILLESSYHLKTLLRLKLLHTSGLEAVADAVAFVQALDDTDVFQKPDHIAADVHNADKFDLMTNLATVTSL